MRLLSQTKLNDSRHTHNNSPTPETSNRQYSWLNAIQVKNINKFFHLFFKKIGFHQTETHIASHEDNSMKSKIANTKITQNKSNITEQLPYISPPPKLHVPKSPLQISADQNAAIQQHKKNKRIIDCQNNISNEERKMYHQFNTLDKAIRLHPNFETTEGIFRLSGNQRDVEFIFLHLDSGLPFNQEFIDKNNISLPSMSCAYKELFGRIIEKENFSTHFLSKSPEQELTDAIQNQRDVMAFIEINKITDEKANAILTKTKTRINNVILPVSLVPFNILTSLFADITKNPITKMDEKNLAISLAPRLIVNQSQAPSMKDFALNSRVIAYLEALIITKL